MLYDISLQFWVKIKASTAAGLTLVWSQISNSTQRPSGITTPFYVAITKSTSLSNRKKNHRLMLLTVLIGDKSKWPDGQTPASRRTSGCNM